MDRGKAPAEAGRRLLCYRTSNYGRKEDDMMAPMTAIPGNRAPGSIEMFPEETWDLLADRIEQHKNIIIAGPPMSGKIMVLNWLLEDGFREYTLEDGFKEYKNLFIALEDDELFKTWGKDRKGDVNRVLKRMLEGPGPAGCTTSPEISDAIYFMGCGDQAIVTVHSPSAGDAAERMVRLIQQDNKAATEKQAKIMLGFFDVVVYVEDNEVKKIREIIGYNEEEGGLVFRDAYNAEDN